MLHDQRSRKVAVIGYNRIPFARQNTAYTNATLQEMLTATIQGLVDKYRLQGELLGEVAAGAVLKSSLDTNLTRESVLGTTLNPATPACDIHQACDTGLETAMYIANKIALGQIEAGIAGGVDSTSNVPLLFGDKLRKAFLAANRAKTTGDKLKAFLNFGLKDLAPLVPSNNEPRTQLSMGEHTEHTVKYYGITREAQDQLAFESHQKLAKAYETDFIREMITPYLGLERDNNLRTDTSLEKLAKLKPAFDKENGTLTAGNSTPLSDGASCILLASEE